MQIANIDRTPKTFRGGEGNSEAVTIGPGETAEVPAHIWKRYATRPDIIASDGVTISIGGKRRLAPEAQKEADDRDQILEEHEKELTRQFTEVAEREAAVKAKGEELRLLEIELVEEKDVLEQQILQLQNENEALRAQLSENDEG